MTFLRFAEMYYVPNTSIRETKIYLNTIDGKKKQSIKTTKVTHNFSVNNSRIVPSVQNYKNTQFICLINFQCIITHISSQPVNNIQIHGYEMLDEPA